jgi:tetratricopeptide (TPR) repeat protein
MNTYCHKGLGIVVMGVALAGCFSATPPQQADEFRQSGDRPPSPRTLYSMARVLVAQGRDDQARYIVTRILHDQPDFIPAYCLMAEIQMRARHVDEAIETLSDGLKIAPREAVLQNDIGMCRVMKKQYLLALQQFTDATALTPGDSRYRGNMAMALGMLGRYEESLVLYTQIMPQADAHYNLGVLCEARQDTARATQEFEQAKVLNAQALKLSPSASAGKS